MFRAIRKKRINEHKILPAELARQQILSVSNTIVILHMLVSIPVYKQIKFALAEKKDFFIHLSLLGGFLGLVGYLVIVCHHMH